MAEIKLREVMHELETPAANPAREALEEWREKAKGLDAIPALERLEEVAEELDTLQERAAELKEARSAAVVAGGGVYTNNYQGGSLTITGSTLNGNATGSGGSCTGTACSGGYDGDGGSPGCDRRDAAVASAAMEVVETAFGGLTFFSAYVE